MAGSDYQGPRSRPSRSNNTVHRPIPMRGCFFAANSELEGCEVLEIDWKDNWATISGGPFGPTRPQEQPKALTAHKILVVGPIIGQVKEAVRGLHLGDRQSLSRRPRTLRTPREIPGRNCFPPPVRCGWRRLRGAHFSL